MGRYHFPLHTAFPSFAITLLWFSAHCLAPLNASAELKPEQVAVIANEAVPEGVAVAEHYLEARKIPRDHLIKLTLPNEDTISRETYERAVVAPVREALTKRNLAAKVRVLVPVYGVPLRVSAPEQTEDDRTATLNAIQTRTNARRGLESIYSLALGLGAAPVDKKMHEGESEERDEELLKRVDTAVRDAVRKVNAKGIDTPEQKKRHRDLSTLVLTFGGLNAVVQNAKPAPGQAAEKTAAHIETMKLQVRQAQQLQVALAELPSLVNRQRLYIVIAQTFGATGLLQRSALDISALQYRDGDAGLDSELQLLWWDRGSYLIAGRLPNPVFHAALRDGKPLPIAIPILMTSRLDAPTPERAKALVDDAIAAEAAGGPAGKFYVDSRGLPPGTDDYAIYDQNLRDLAWLVREESDVTVKLDKEETRFSNPGDAPDVAAYVGWYKLRDYEDAFTFNKGAVGFHIASEEAITIHDKDEKGWCKNALERGIAATLGATAEPFLDSFPMPLEFFGLLMTGRYSLAEAFQLTSRYLSWRIVLFGDPLYRPWKNAPKLESKALAAKSERAKTLDPLPPPQGERQWNEPTAARAELEKKKKEMGAQVDVVFEKIAAQMKQKATEKANAPHGDAALPVAPQ